MTSLPAQNGRLSREWQSIDPAVQVKLREMQTDPNIPLGKMAKSLGLSVKVATLPANISGELRPCPQNKAAGFEITINRHNARVRQRFTLAHEIAHFLLHSNSITDEGVQDNVFYRSNLPDSQEAEANRLAADIIMPMHIIDQEVKRIGKNPADFDEHDVEKMAERLQVSQLALQIRLDIVV